MDTIGNIPLFLYGVVQRVNYNIRSKKRQPTNTFNNNEIANIILTKNGHSKHLESNIVGKLFILRDGNSKGESINNWIKTYGKQFKYVFIFDSDSDVQDKNYVNCIKYFKPTDAWIQTTIKATRGVFSKDTITFFKNNPENFISCGHNVVYKTEVLLNNKFDEETGEDFLMSIRLWKKGYTSYLADTITYEENPLRFKDYVKREIKWSSFEVKYIKKLKDVWTAKVLTIQNKLNLSFLFLRSTISVLITVLLLTTLILNLPVNNLFFLMFLLFAIIPTSSLLMIILSLPLNVLTSIGFISGIFSKSKNRVITENIENHYKKELYISYFLLIVILLMNCVDILSKRIYSYPFYLYVILSISLFLF